jgi:hypothetical protein
MEEEIGRVCSMHELFMRNFDGSARRKEPIGRTRRRWEDKNKNVVKDQNMSMFWIIRLSTKTSDGLFLMELSASSSRDFTPRKEGQYPLDNRLNGPKNRLAIVERMNILSLPGNEP